MLKGKWLNIIGLGVTALGLGASLIGDWINDKKMTETIRKEVEKYLANK